MTSVELIDTTAFASSYWLCRGSRSTPIAPRPPPFVKTVKEAIKPHGGRLRLFFMDKARFGQQSTTTRMWAPKESRPTAVKRLRYKWVYLYVAVEPTTDATVARQAQHMNTETMNVFLKMVADQIKPDEHAALIMDQAGWHKAKKLVVPENITILHLDSPTTFSRNAFEYPRTSHSRTCRRTRRN